MTSTSFSAPLRRTAGVLLIALAAIVFAAPAHAQDPPRKIKFRLATFGQGVGGKTEYVTKLGGQDTVDAIPRYVTNYHDAELRDQRFLDFYEKGRLPEGDEPMKPDFSVAVPSDAGSDLLVFLTIGPDGEREGRLFDFRKMRFDFGDQMIFNDLPVPLGVRFTDGEGEARGDYKAVRPKDEAKMPAPRDKRSLRQIAYYNPNTKQWVQFVSSLYFKDEESREIVFCYAVKGRKDPVVETIAVHKIDSDL